MKIYGPELRQSALAALERGEKRRSVSLMFEVSVPTLDRWRRQQRQSGQVASRPRGHLRCAFEAKESAVLEELLLAVLRDLLMHLAIAGAVAARWTNTIHDEWTRNVLANRPDLSRERIERTRDLMNAAVRDCLVTGYEPLISQLSLPDPDDRHVLAAAIACGAESIVTFNTRDFPALALTPHNIDALHPDEFVLRLLDTSEEAVCLAVRQQRAFLKNPPKSVDEHLTTLEAAGMKQTVARLQPFADEL